MSATARERVTVIPHRNDWTQLQRTSIDLVESYLASRGFHRRGQVIEVPLTIGHVQFWLRRIRAPHQGRDYARQVIATLVDMKVLEDTGRTMKPRRQPNPLRNYWWRVWRVLPLTNARKHYHPHQSAYPRAAPDRAGCPPPVSLYRFLRRQGLISRPKRLRNARPGSVQWAFLHSGPP